MTLTISEANERFQTATASNPKKDKSDCLADLIALTYLLDALVIECNIITGTMNKITTEFPPSKPRENILLMRNYRRR